MKSTPHSCSSGRRWNLQKLFEQCLHSYPSIPVFLLHVKHLFRTFFSSFSRVLYLSVLFSIERLVSLRGRWRVYFVSIFSVFYFSSMVVSIFGSNVFNYALFFCISKSSWTFCYLKHLEHMLEKVSWPYISLHLMQSSGASFWMTFSSFW